ncbi:MAG: coniferyl aldehyde dehydrogenase [Myxococcota bacterium]
MSDAGVAAQSFVDLGTILDQLREAYRADPQPDHAVRRAKLDAMLAEVRARRDELVSAISADFGHRSRHESMTFDVLQVVNTLRYVKRNLAAWMAPEPVPLAMVYQPARAEVVPQPLGVVGVISPWNYPVQLGLVPLIYALGAGNRVMLKPSELSPRSSEVVTGILERAVGTDWVRVVEGDADVGAQFAALPFDHLFFTGSTRVGRLVAQAAAANLTPVTLELGGKSPVLVHPDFPTRKAAELIAFGKLANAGQTCVGVDYAVVREDQADALVAELQAVIPEMYATFDDNPDYTAIATQRHRDRLAALLDDAEQKGATLIEVNPKGEPRFGESGKVVPVLVRGVTREMRILQEEIFGPLLPIVETGSWEAMVDVVNEGERPLSMYVLDRNDKRVNRVLRQTHSGGVAVNEVLIQAGIESLAFGGVGASGMGKYHGRDGFETFSHRKPVVYQSRFNLRQLVAPPFGKVMDRLLDWLI